MQEIQSGQEGAQETQPAEEKNAPVMRDMHQNGSHEPLWGIFLIAGMILFVLASIGGIGWIVYSQWQSERAAESRPSIGALPEQSNGEGQSTESSEAAQASASGQSDGSAEQTDTESMAAAKKLEISVLNGGAAKGSAGVLADFLKQEGYLKTDAGNTLNNYTGVTVYHAANLEKETEAIKASVIKKYLQVKVLPADASNKETSVSQVTIILGK